MSTSPKDKERRKIEELLGKHAVIDYERNHSHYHCWHQDQPPACGIPLEKHKQCCLCDSPLPNKPTTLREEVLNIFYYMNAVSMEKIDGALRCEITRRQLDKVLAENHEMIVPLSHHTELISKIEGMRKEFDPDTAEGMYHDFVAVDGFNEAIDEVISFINQEK